MIKIKENEKNPSPNRSPVQATAQIGAQTREAQNPPRSATRSRDPSDTIGNDQAMLGQPRSPLGPTRQLPDHPQSRSKTSDTPRACQVFDVMPLGHSRTKASRDQLSPDTSRPQLPDPTPTQRPARLHTQHDPTNPTRPDQGPSATVPENAIRRRFGGMNSNRRSKLNQKV